MANLESQNPDLSLVLSSCEPELQELMRQIDIMIGQQKDQWEAEIRTLQVQLKTTQEELATSKELLQRKGLETALLQKQQESTKTDRKELISKYEQQLQKVCEELNKLKKSYQKLQRKHVKQDSTGAKDSDQSEISKLKEKIEEHQRRSIDWEQQCVQYQKQLSTVETQNKSLTQELSLLKSQSFLPKEPEHKECCSQLQRLRNQLEKTQSSLHLHELELEQLRPLEVWLGQYQREQKIHAVERETLDFQDSFVQRSSFERQRLRNETASLNQQLQAKDQVIRCLEDCLAAHGSAGVESIRSDLEKTTAKLKSAESSETELQAERSLLREKFETVSRQREDQSKTEQELKSIKAEYESCTAEMKKLKEELQRAQQTHSGEVERMRQEVSKLTSDLHQRDHTISSHSGALSGIAEQLRGEQQRSQQRNDELRAQLDVLREENQRLKSLLQRQDSRSSKRKDQRDSPGLEQVLSPSNSSSQEKLQTAVQGNHTDPKTVREQGSGSSHEGEIQRLFQQLQVKPHPSTGPSLSGGSETSRGQSPAPSGSSSEPNLDRRNSAPSDSAADGSMHWRARERGTGAESRPPSPSDGTVSRFLEEESLRSRELLQRLDFHIHNMTESNTRTVSKYLPSAAATQD